MGRAATFTGAYPVGYDSRSGWFHPNFVTTFPISLQAWDSLVTTISQFDAPNKPDYAPGSWNVAGQGWRTNFDPNSSTSFDAMSPTRLASVLTILPEVPPGTVGGLSPFLRPPYGGTPANRAQLSEGTMSGGSQPTTYLRPWAWNPTTFLSRTPSVVRPTNVY